MEAYSNYLRHLKLLGYKPFKCLDCTFRASDLLPLDLGSKEGSIGKAVNAGNLS